MIKSAALTHRTRKVRVQQKELYAPNLFASYRLGDVTRAGLRRFPWKITNTQAVLVNAYDLIENPKSKSYRRKLEENGESIREHIGFDGPLMIDSGAYYFIRTGNVHISPLTVLETQSKSGADIGVVLDHPFSPAAKDKQKRINRTLKNTEEMFAEYANAGYTGFGLLPVVHGHDSRTLKATIARLRRIAEKYDDGNLDMVGVGSLAPLAQNGKKATLVEVLTTVRELLPDTYIHCFSLGSALLMLLAFYCGVDTVDSQTWVLSAAFKYVQLPGHYFIRLASGERASDPSGYTRRVEAMKKRILQLYDQEGFYLKDWNTGKILRDPNNDDLNQYIRELTDEHSNEHVHNRACHNLWVFNFEAKRARQEIERGNFEPFVESRLKDCRYYKAFLQAKEIRRM